MNDKYGKEGTIKNFYALLACILNPKLTVGGALKYMGLSQQKEKLEWEVNTNGKS